MELRSLFLTHILIMLNICTKCHENISKGFRVTEGLNFQCSKFSKGHNSVKNVGRNMVLALCKFSNHALYLYKVF